MSKHEDRRRRVSPIRDLTNGEHDSYCNPLPVIIRLGRRSTEIPVPPLNKVRIPLQLKAKEAQGE